MGVGGTARWNISESWDATERRVVRSVSIFFYFVVELGLVCPAKLVLLVSVSNILNKNVIRIEMCF